MAAKRKPYTFYVDLELAAGLERIRERDGVPVSEQIRRAIRAWLDTKEVKKAPQRTKRS